FPAPCASAPPRSRSGVPSANANVSPTEPASTSRRLGPCDFSRVFLLLVMSRLPSRPFDGADDARIGAATAEHAIHVGDALRARRRLIAREQVRGLHDLTRLAVAALRHLLGDPGFLQGVAVVF